MSQNLNKRLTDNQRVLLIQAMKRYDRMLCDLIDKAKDVDAMGRPEEKLSQNSDFKKKLLAYHARFTEHLEKHNLIVPVFFEASELALYNANQIVAGQSRSHVRQNINRYRCDLLHRMETDTVNVNYSCDGSVQVV